MKKSTPTVSNVVFHRNKLGISIALFSALILSAPANAAIRVFQISNFPSIQSGAELSGSITVDTAIGIESPASSGNFFLGHNAITAWDFSVTPTVGSPYALTSTGLNASATGLGSGFAFYVTPTQFSLLAASTLSLEADVDDVPGASVALDWNYDLPVYSANGTGIGGATWLNTSRTELDNAFPTNPDAPAANWVIAAAVPEPSQLSLIFGIAALTFLSKRRFKKFLS